MDILRETLGKQTYGHQMDFRGADLWTSDRGSQAVVQSQNHKLWFKVRIITCGYPRRPGGPVDPSFRAPSGRLKFTCTGK